jgi:hypothetical protein
VDQIKADQQLIRELVNWAGGVPSRVATQIGVAATTITRPYKGTSDTRLGRDTINKLREHYPDFPGWAERNGRVRSEVGQRGEDPIDQMFGSADLPGIPLVGSAIGIRSFDPERDIELTDLDMAEVLYHLRRPMSLADDGKAYALTVIGDSMAPKYDPGTRVIVSPKATVQIRDYVVVQLKSEDVEDQYEERVTSVLIKRLVRRSASFIELMQFNPETTFRVGTERIAAIHKVIGEAY